MGRLIFEPSGYKVKWGVETLELLAKEFALLQFLYHHRERAFTRDQLLDQVWPMEFPVERTVDDHIYRLRKKLGVWRHIQINTVRGYGYSLTVKEPKSMFNPSVADRDVNTSMREIFKKYHLFGQGKSMLVLATQQDILGFEVDPFYAVYLKFIQGDIAWFLEAEDLPMETRLYWLLLLYRGVNPEPQQMLHYCQLAVAHRLLSPQEHREMKILNILEVYADAGLALEAMKRFEETRKTVEAEELSGFVMPVAIMEMYVYVLAGELEQADAVSERLGSLLRDAPYLREIGRFRIVQGLLNLRRGREQEAEQCFDEGLDVLEMSLNVPLRMISLSQIMRYIAHNYPGLEMARKYALIYESLDQKHGLSKHKRSLEAIIGRALSIF
ncbi:winged helix-turn-helix domain-containing protein [Paenibacillus lentus]|uniref:Winged helix family transcriptional regulator n=1 Tax=Paenibacillus lentus TaxID=1338368 RepID=A0A3Q8SAF3_9BACL|nr:winged helix-turn-helix domain-containing protein [Paenibacillus lentus]AZK46116.1 winged helix family transcriptional regulator [Paenibacillus lentus]